MMSNREHFDAICQLLEHDVIRKPGDRQPSRRSGHEGNPSAAGWRTLNQFKSSLHLVNEPICNL